MSIRKQLTIAIAMLLASILIVVFLASQRAAPESREVTPTAMPVDVILAETAAERFLVTSQGTVQPRTQTTLVSEVSGKVTALSPNFVPGGFFRANEVLAEIDPSDYRAALMQAEAELAAAEARLSEERARSDLARRDWQDLHGDTRQANELVLRLPQLANAEAALQAAEAGVLRAQRNLDRTQIRLPYDGMVRARQIDIGQYVTPGNTLGVAFAVDTAEVRLPLADRDLAFLDLPAPGQSPAQGLAVRFWSTVLGERGEWSGSIVRTEGVIEQSTQLTYAVAEIVDPYGLLGDRSDPGQTPPPLPMGTFVQAEIEGRSALGLIELPREALREGDRVFLANAEDRLEIRRVGVLRATANRVYLHNDLYPGDRVITTAIQAPIPGALLRVREIDSGQPSLQLLPAELAATEDIRP